MCICEDRLFRAPISLFCQAGLGELYYVRSSFVLLQFLEEYFCDKAGRGSFDCTVWTGSRFIFSNNLILSNNQWINLALFREL